MQVTVAVQQRLRLQCGHIPTCRPKGDQHTRHPRRPRRLTVRIAVTNQHTFFGMAASTPCGFEKMLRIRLAHRKRIGPQHRVKGVPHPKPRQQRIGQPFRFIGADRDAKARLFQHRNRLHRAWIKKRVRINIRRIGLKQHGVIGINRMFFPAAPQPVQSQPQHRPCPAQRGRGITPRIQQIARAHVPKTGVGRRNQIAAGVRQRTIEIKNNRLHAHPPRAEARPIMLQLATLFDPCQTCAFLPSA